MGVITAPIRQAKTYKDWLAKAAALNLKGKACVTNAKNDWQTYRAESKGWFDVFACSDARLNGETKTNAIEIRPTIMGMPLGGCNVIRMAGIPMSERELLGQIETSRAKAIQNGERYGVVLMAHEDCAAFGHNVAKAKDFIIERLKKVQSEFPNVLALMMVAHLENRAAGGVSLFSVDGKLIITTPYLRQTEQGADDDRLVAYLAKELETGGVTHEELRAQLVMMLIGNIKFDLPAAPLDHHESWIAVGEGFEWVVDRSAHIIGGGALKYMLREYERSLKMLVELVTERVLAPESPLVIGFGRTFDSTKGQDDLERAIEDSRQMATLLEEVVRPFLLDDGRRPGKEIISVAVATDIKTGLANLKRLDR